jgi:hypothetical protein
MLLSEAFSVTFPVPSKPTAVAEMSPPETEKSLEFCNLVACAAVPEIVPTILANM